MKDDAVFFRHILDAASLVESYLEGVSKDEFLSNSMRCDAVVRQLEIIGEAARNVSDEGRERLADVEWGQIVGMRNRLIHAYFQVDYDLVWEIATTDVPALSLWIQALLG